MGYDNMYNITSKVQHITQKGVQFSGTLQAGYNLGYTIADNCQQIANIADTTYRTEGTGTVVPEYKVSQFSYDANGNLLSINTGTKQGDKLLSTNSRKMLWDEENRMLATNDNGYVTSYWYDAAGERTVKESGDGEGVLVNGVLSGERTGTTNFTAYISPYLIVRNGGEYTKHIYMGGQRITSKVSNSGIFANSPVTTTDLQVKYAAQTASLKVRYDSLGITYKGTAQTGGLISSSPSGAGGNSYFYHSDHLGSSSLITDQFGDIGQHIEYVPYGGTFIDERRSASSWHTPFLFSGKERDEETGLLYVSQRYQDEKYGIWYGVDQLAEKYPNMSSYVYCADNPVKYVDPDGREKIIALKNSSKNTAIINAAKNYPDDEAIHIFAHGSPFAIFPDDSNSPLKTAKDLDRYLLKRSNIWRNKKEGQHITIVLHSCRTSQQRKNGSPSVAQSISKEMPVSNITIIAPDRRDVFSGGTEVGPRFYTHVDMYDDYLKGEHDLARPTQQRGNWLIYENGSLVSKMDGDWRPTDFNYEILGTEKPWKGIPYNLPIQTNNNKKR